MAPAFQMPAKPHRIRLLKTRFTNTTDFAIPPRVLPNRPFSFLDQNNPHNLVSGFVQENLSEVSRTGLPQGNAFFSRETPERSLCLIGS